jgi:hypothetical protein
MSNRPQQPTTSASTQPEASISTGKRSLLKYGWTAPLIVAVSLPKSGFAANISGKHGDDGRGHGGGGKGKGK